MYLYKAYVKCIPVILFNVIVFSVYSICVNDLILVFYSYVGYVLIHVLNQLIFFPDYGFIYVL